MEKNWRKVLKSIWRSQNDTTIKEIVSDTGLIEYQVHNSVNHLKRMELIKTRTEWKKIGKMPRSKKIISIDMSKEKVIRRAVENE